MLFSLHAQLYCLSVDDILYILTVLNHDNDGSGPDLLCE